MSNGGGEEQRRANAKAAEAAMAKVGRDTARIMQTSGEQHQLLEFINRRFDEFVPGVSSIGLLMCFLASATTLLGPVTIEFISSVRPDGSQATWSQPAGCFYLFVAGPGQFKSGTMQICSNAIHAVLHAVKGLKTSLGGSINVHTWIDHITNEASIFKDGSTSAWFERIKEHPTLMTFLYYCDEFDVVAKRVKNDKSSGELGAWLSLWNVGGTLWKNTGQINVGVHHIFSNVFALGQFALAYELGCDEDANGRGFAPRFIFAAGHLDTRKWPSSNEANYFKMLLQRFRMKAAGRVTKAQHEPGSMDFITNSLSLLMFASVVYLHIIPRATSEALQAEMEKFSTAPNADEVPTTPLPTRGMPSTPGVEDEHDTPALAALLGMSPRASPDAPECSQSTSDDSENGNGKRNIKGGAPRDGRPREEPTKEASDLRWGEKSIRMYPSNEAQNAIAQYFESCETRERECIEKGSSALAPYWRKAKDNMLRLVGVVHLASGGAELLNASGLDLGARVRPRDLCALIADHANSAYKEGRYLATSTDAAGISHMIGKEAVEVAKLILEEHMKLVSAIHSSSQVRYVPLMQLPGFLILAADAHASLGWNTDTFIELGKLAMRAGLGLYVCLEPVKWKGDAFESDCVKTGGHALHAFIKADVPSTPADPRHLTIATVLNKLGLSVASFRATLYQQPPGPASNAGQARRLQAPSKLLQAAAFISKRTDLIAADIPDDDWYGRSIAEEAHVASDPKRKPAEDDYWTDTEKMTKLHQCLLRLCVAAAKTIDAAKATNDAKHFTLDLPAKQ